jgi:hypothetical protein
MACPGALCADNDANRYEPCRAFTFLHSLDPLQPSDQLLQPSALAAKADIQQLTTNVNVSFHRLYYQVKPL